MSDELRDSPPEPPEWVAHKSQLTACQDHVATSLSSLFELLRGTDIIEFELHEGDVRIRVHRVLPEDAERAAGPANGPVGSAEVPPPPVGVEITSPLVGTFFRSAEPDASPLVTEGSHVVDDTVVGIVTALGGPNEVEAGCTGVVTKVLASDGQGVEYGQPLFEVMRSG